MFIKSLYKIITAEFSYGTTYSFDLHSISSTPISRPDIVIDSFIKKLFLSKDQNMGESI